MIVQKYGGSSVGTPEKIRNVAARIVRARSNGGGQKTPVVVVVSAMGDTTDELIELAGQVSPRLTSQVHDRELDMLLTAGERISMALVSMALRDLGQDSISFTGSQAGIITDECHTRAHILEVRPMRIQEELARGRVVIVAGFQGVSRKKEVTTLGRGGSDTTAVALAAALGATRCEVFTDVPGIFSADPRLVPGARRYEELPLDLVFELAVKGAQVMHARSIEIARERGFPIFVGLAHPKAGISGDGTLFLEEGTMLVPKNGDQALELPKVVGVTAKRGLRALEFRADQAPTVLKEISADSVLVHGVTLTQTGGLHLLVDPGEATGFLSRHANAVSPIEVAAVSLVGYQMQHNVRIPARVCELLATSGIAVAGLTCHPSSITVWFPDAKAGSSCDLAVRSLHEAFI